MKVFCRCLTLFSFCLSACHSRENTVFARVIPHENDSVAQNRIIDPEVPKAVFDSTSEKHFSLRNLSHQFNVDLDVTRFIEEDHVHDSCIVRTRIIDKMSKRVIDSLLLTSRFFYTNYFDNSRHAVSYSTGVHVFMGGDNYFGDLVVADLNFDGRDDIALINDQGGNGGPVYSFYSQKADGKFILDQYLTDSISYFPTDIDRKGKTLTTYVHAGACCMGKQVYQFDKENSRWKMIEHVLIGLNEKNTVP